MSEIEPEIERAGANLKKKIAELERTIAAVVKAIKSIEEETGEAFMPEGTYCGIKFED